MRFALRLRPEVVADLEHASNWYKKQRPDIEAAFLQESKRALDRVLQNPRRNAADSTGIRSHKLHRFPYLIHYRVEGSYVVVFAIVFGGRDPSAWRDRI